MAPLRPFLLLLLLLLVYPPLTTLFTAVQGDPSVAVLQSDRDMPTIDKLTLHDTGKHQNREHWHVVDDRASIRPCEHSVTVIPAGEGDNKRNSREDVEYQKGKQPELVPTLVCQGKYQKQQNNSVDSPGTLLLVHRCGGINQKERAENTRERGKEEKEARSKMEKGCSIFVFALPSPLFIHVCKIAIIINFFGSCADLLAREPLDHYRRRAPHPLDTLCAKEQKH